MVEKIFVEQGRFVENGQPLLQFSNSDLQLNVARNDNSITERLNNLTNIANGFDTTKINTERELIDSEYKILTLEHWRPREEKLAKDGLISNEQYEGTLDPLNYLGKLREKIRSRQVLQNKIGDERRQQIAVQIGQLEGNLQLSKAALKICAYAHL